MVAIESIDGVTGEKKLTHIAVLTGEQVEHYWQEFEQLLDAEPELWQRAFTKQGLKQQLLDGGVHLWAVANAREEVDIFFLSRVYRTEVEKIFQIFWMMGHDLSQALPAIEVLLDDVAGRQGCTFFEVVGRKGFERVLGKIGFRFEAATFFRPVLGGTKQ